MNSDQEKLRTLLDDVLPSSGEHCGPSSAEVLAMLRDERQRRRRRHTGAALLAILAVAAGTLLWNNKPPAVAPVVQATVKPAPIVIHRVNDEELFALLQGTPTALMKLPIWRRPRAPASTRSRPGYAQFNCAISGQFTKSQWKD